MASCLALANERSQIAQWNEGNKLEESVVVVVVEADASFSFSFSFSLFLLFLLL